jgi:iron-sulfur cluster assembly protein
MSNIITLTEAAENHIKTMLDKADQGIGFRLSIKKTGCSGYAYVPNIVDKVNEHDIHFMSTHGLNVYVDPACQDFVKELVIDYVSDNHAGIKQKRLVFINPNEKNRCGCGESFTIE